MTLRKLGTPEGESLQSEDRKSVEAAVRENKDETIPNANGENDAPSKEDSST
jgi:hypothetical protein